MVMMSRSHRTELAAQLVEERYDGGGQPEGRIYETH